MQSLGNITPLKQSILLDKVANLVKATGLITSDNTNPSAAGSLVIGTQTYVFVANITAKVRATQTLTASDVLEPGDTITIGNKTYTMVEALSDPRAKVANEVLIGATVALSLDNLKSAINRDGNAGLTFSLMTEAHTQVTATTNTDSTQVVQAIAYGTDGNSIEVSKVAANASWGDTVLAGGANGVPNEIKIGADANTTLANLKKAINGSATEGTEYGWGTVANPQATAETIDTGAHTMVIQAITAGSGGNDVVFTEDSDHLSISGSGTLGGTTAGSGLIGEYVITEKNSGLMKRLIHKSPALTGTITYTLTIMDADGVFLYTVASIAESTTTQVALEMVLVPGDIIRITASGATDSDEPFVVILR